MTGEFLILALIVITALVFDFTNGFHDTANAMATSIATGALHPKSAVLLSAALNLIGAFLSIEVALTVTNSVIRIQDSDGNPLPALMGDGGGALLMILLAGLAGAILWNLATWAFSLPSSSSHALFGGLIGATIASIGWQGVKWAGDGTLDGVLGKVVMPALVSPVLAIIVAAIGTWTVLKITRVIEEKARDTWFRWGQIGSASLVSLAHGTNDAQKTMGIITLALLATGHWHDTHSVALWVKVSCALAIALGTYSGGWRIIRTLGKGLVDISSPQGMAAESASAAIILASSHMGFALSTTQVATGSILGSGVGRSGANVRWSIAGKMALAWLITLPMSAIAAAIIWWIGHFFGGSVLAAWVMIAILVAGCLAFYRHARTSHVDHRNVNDEWESAEPAREEVRS
ncbi:MAG TPA: anion permease [Actinomycetaceae bacterium]|nr:anion permease [Actinomycetaceae bacterium]